MANNLRKALFIDRDGTIIREPDDEQVDSLEKLRFVPGAISGLKMLTDKGYELVMVTNQDGLGTDAFPEETFWPAHNLMMDTLEGEGVKFDDVLIDRTFPADNAPTRKPGTGMLGKYLAGDYDLASSYVIGDRLTDIALARNLGARGILLADAEVLPEGCTLATTNWKEAARHILAPDREAVVERKTRETDIRIYVNLDNEGQSHVDTGLKFFDHMLSQLPHHGGFTLQVDCRGDLEVDEHHTMEDVAIALGEALKMAVADKCGMERYGFVLPMDESRAMVLLDFGGRADLEWDVEFTREYIGDTPTEMFRHVFQSLASAMQANIHVSARGENNHHLVEGIFKALARALRQAIARNPFSHSIASSKGTI